MQGQQLKNK